jgi:ABC-type sugar transport system substrate-binding protein
MASVRVLARRRLNAVRIQSLLRLFIDLRREGTIVILVVLFSATGLSHSFARDVIVALLLPDGSYGAFFSTIENSVAAKIIELRRTAVDINISFATVRASSPGEQLSQLTNLEAKKVDAVLIWPFDGLPIETLVAARQNGVRIAALRHVASNEIAEYVPDYDEAGKAIAEVAAKASAQDSDVLVIGYPFNQQMRDALKATDTALTQKSRRPMRIEIGDFSAEKTMKAASDALRRTEHPGAVIAFGYAPEVARVVAETGQSRLPVFGFGAGMENLRAIKEGQIVATVDLREPEIAALAMAAVLGQALSSNSSCPNGGSCVKPHQDMCPPCPQDFRLLPLIVDKSNIERYRDRT